MAAQMSSTITIVQRCAEAAFGLSLLYLRFCLYETEEGALRNYLVELWVRIYEISANRVQQIEKLLGESAKFTLIVFERVFGQALLSLRAASVSLGLATAAVSFEIYWIAPDFHLARGDIWRPLVYLTAGVLPAIFKARRVQVIPIVSALLISAGLVLNHASGDTSGDWYAVGLVCAVIADFAWLLLFRWSTQWAVRRGGVLPHCLVILVGSLVSIGCLFLLPNDLSIEPLRLWLWLFPKVPRELLYCLSIVGSSRIYISLVSSAQLLILLFATIHWLSWPLLSRIVYSMERYNFLKERKWFGTAGGIVLAHAISGNAWISAIVKSVH
jgi:hypothetical protein